MQDALFSWDLFHRLPVVGILRGFGLDHVMPLAEASMKGGLTNLEITMNTPQATGLIAAVRKRAGGRMNVGAGTVCSTDELERAVDAGAQFVVTPIVLEDVIVRAREIGVAVMPGAMTPTEVARAWSTGADLVKVFPANCLGPEYIRSLRGPFPDVRLMPTGGVDLESLPAYFLAGADAVGVGGPLFSKGKVQEGDWTWVEEQVRAFAETYGSLRGDA